MDNTSEGAGEYELVPERVIAKPRNGGTPREVIPAPLNYRSTMPQPTVKTAPEEMIHLQLPIWLLAGGVVIEVVASCLRERSIGVAMAVVGAQLVLGTAILLAGVLTAMRMRGIAIGSLPIAALKLAAIVVAPAAAVDLLEPAMRFIPFGGLIGWGVSFLLYFALLGALFELDESDTWYCVWVIFLVRLAVFFGLLFGVLRWL